MEWQLFIEILLIHFLADFGLQTHEQANKKGEGKSFWNIYLFRHVLTYTLVWFVWLICHCTDSEQVILGTVFVFVTHYITDWITSRLSKPLFASENYHDGFVIIGADQVAHYLSLIFLMFILR